MATYIESGISLNFPDENHFRFEKCETYCKLNGFGFKEMDACWFDIENNKFFCVELKDYTLANMRLKSQDIIENLVNKSVHTLQMLNARILNTEFSTGFNDDVSFPFPENAEINLISILKLDKKQKADFNPIRDVIKGRLKPYQKLFDINVLITTHEGAMKKFNG